MLLIINENQFNNNYIEYGERNKNNIINNSYFYSISYVNQLFSIQYLYIEFTLNNIFIEEYYNKYKINIKDNNTNTLNFIKQLETQILNKFSKNITKKYKKCKKLNEQIEKNNIKGISNKKIKNSFYSSLDCLIKISGIWEHNDEIGLIYKILIL